jgi:hypothetical protein
MKPLAVPGVTVAVVTGMTAAARAGAVPEAGFTSSVTKVAQGRLWLLVTNALFVQRPVLLSLGSFALLAFVSFLVCGGLVASVSAVAGHVGSTVAAYGVVAAISFADPAAVRGILTAPDYGVSAIQAAWIGALAANAWRREGRSGRGRVFVVLACVAIGIVAWMVRRDVTVLDVDHLFAFVIGACVEIAALGGAARRVTAARRDAPLRSLRVVGRPRVRHRLRGL